MKDLGRSSNQRNQVVFSRIVYYHYTLGNTNMKLAKKIVFVILVNENYHKSAHLIINIPKGGTRNDGKANTAGN
jgi:hypothetical protein